MKTKLLVPMTAVLIVIAVFALALGQEPGKLKKIHECCGIPDLTEEQKAQIDALKMNLEKEMLPMKTKLEVKQAELQELLVADSPNKGAIDKKIDEIGSLRTQIQKKRIDNRLKIRALLTPEQRVKFDKKALMGHKCCGLRGMSHMGKKMMHVRKFKRGCKPMEHVKEKVEIKEIKE